MNTVKGRVLRRLGFGHIFRIVDVKFGDSKCIDSIILTIGNHHTAFVLKHPKSLRNTTRNWIIPTHWDYQYIGHIRKIPYLLIK